jgi:hypothetical protein
MWIHVKNNSFQNEFWYLDYENGIATLQSEKPTHESIRKWDGTIQEFLNQRGTEIIAESNETVKFKPNPNR